MSGQLKWYILEFNKPYIFYMVWHDRICILFCTILRCIKYFSFCHFIMIYHYKLIRSCAIRSIIHFIWYDKIGRFLYIIQNIHIFLITIDIYIHTMLLTFLGTFFWSNSFLGTNNKTLPIIRNNCLQVVFSIFYSIFLWTLFFLFFISHFCICSLII